MSKELLDDAAVVFVLDDDDAVRESLCGLFQSIGLQAVVLGSAKAFLQRKRPDKPACLVLDVRLPDMSGLDFQEMLAGQGIEIPIIFLTGYGDIPMTVKALQRGAVAFLTKPVREEELLHAVRTGIGQDRLRRTREKMVAGLKARFESLTAREQQTFQLVTTGLMNKQVAAELGVSEITIKAHRGNVMRKMEAHTLADLVRMSDLLCRIEAPPHQPSIEGTHRAFGH
jgi:FixJ family two-component response regulator